MSEHHPKKLSWLEQLWFEHGEERFIVVPSSEASRATAEQVEGARPANSRDRTDMSQEENKPNTQRSIGVSERIQRSLGICAQRIESFINPTPEEQERRARERVARIWNRHGRDGFLVVRSAEGSMATPESVKHLYPADMIPITDEEPSEKDPYQR